MLRFILFSFIVWRFALNTIAWIGANTIYPKKDFMSPTIWANFDGSHYLSIAKQGYLQYQQAFFPLFPAILHFLGPPFNWNYIYAGFFVVHLTFIITLFLLWKLIRIEFEPKIAMWTIVFLLLFPTSFFFGGIYTESLFLMLILGSFYAARKKNWLIASVLGGLATATRLVGIALLPALIYEWWQQHKFKIQNSKFKIGNKDFLWLLFIPLGLVIYMVYLNATVGDPFAFIHVQPAFGANRSGGEIILLPQVLFRYLKIFTTVSWIEYDVRIAFLELFMLIFVLSLLFLSWKTIRKSYLIFAILAIIIPTLTGTLSSMPRYVVAAFPFFIILALTGTKVLKLLLVLSFSLLLIILTMLFTRGYFVA